jgi:hypothetical protein
MSTIITAGNATNNGASLLSAADGELEFKTGSGAGTTALTLSTSQIATFASSASVLGSLTVSGTVTASGGVSGGIRSGTAVASTSGTSIDFTSLPTGIKRITVMFNGVSLSGTSSILIQIGSGSVTTTGYVSSTSVVINAAASASLTSTSGFIEYVAAAANIIYGQVIITNVTSNTWVSSHSIGFNGLASAVGGGNSPNLSGSIDRVRITTVNGTDTFDAGSINILYE